MRSFYGLLKELLDHPGNFISFRGTRRWLYLVFLDTTPISLKKNGNVDDRKGGSVILILLTDTDGLTQDTKTL